MKVLLTGASGYIGKRLVTALLKEGHEVVCCVRDKRRFDITKYNSNLLSVIEVNFLREETLDRIPDEIDAAYYLIHSMSATTGDFQIMEETSARIFREKISQTQAKQVIYLSGIVNEADLSKHLSSRKSVEDILFSGNYHLTTLRAGIIVGSGSASFEIIRDLVEKLPIMITPKWLNTRSQPIGVRNVIEFLTGVLHLEETYDKNYDIGGPEVLTYKEMLLKFAKVRKLKRSIWTIPVFTPKLSSYWLYFVTSTSYKLSINLVNSMKIEVVCRKNNLAQFLNIKLIPYEEAVRMAFDKIKNHDVSSSWIDALSSPALEKGISSLVTVPTFGCYTDQKKEDIKNGKEVLERIWNIGGKKGWYYANWLWHFRGFLDKIFGGVGLRRGRKSPDDIVAGDALDFWRVLYANKSEKRLLLYAEMRLPGEAWLEFQIRNGTLYQTATYRPLGIGGRLYWYILLPFHYIVFKGMIQKNSIIIMGFYQFYTSQKIPSNINKVWDFISSPSNLKKITPDHMGFDIITPHLSEKMYPGMIIAYKVSPVMGIKMTWVTEITHIREQEYFVDEQRIGPYTIWHHEHKIRPIEGGVLMNDIVSYKPPFGILGSIANGLFIRKQLKGIFDYREKAIIDIFGSFQE